jgi:hypothetical protein
MSGPQARKRVAEPHVEQLRRHRATGFGLEAKEPYTDGGWRAPGVRLPHSRRH